MRTIRFRAWHSKIGMMNNGTLIQDDLSPLIKTSINKESLIFMQFTGLTDKNGKEIYDCDIVRIDHLDERYDVLIHQVKWSKDAAEWDFGCGVASEVNWSHEVIGNIYNNSELLK